MKHTKIQVELRVINRLPTFYRQADGAVTGLGVCWFVLVSPGGLEVGEKAGVSQAGVWVS